MVSLCSLPSPEYLRYLRKKAGLTQKQLAEKAGVSQSLIARIERGTVDPRLSTLRRIMRVLEEVLAEKSRAKDFMHHPVVTIHEGDTLKKAAKIMWEYGYSQLPVVDEKGFPVGTIYENTIINAIMRYREKAFDMKVKDVMEKALPIVDPSEPADRVFDLLIRDFPAVLVVEKGRIVGIITKSDIIARHLL
ncbi:MAG: transcriptional regulator [Thermoprotei archaeon]|nr:MAG: transcriptional regulator [Thermoprotei archaeon]